MVKKPLPAVPPSPTMFKFSGAKLKTARLHAGISRMTLARRIEFLAGPRSITRYEMGTYLPNVDTAMAMAKVLEVDLEDLTDAKG